MLNQNGDVRCWKRKAWEKKNGKELDVVALYRSHGHVGGNATVRVIQIGDAHYFEKAQEKTLLYVL